MAKDLEAQLEKYQADLKKTEDYIKKLQGSLEKKIEKVENQKAKITEQKRKKRNHALIEIGATVFSEIKKSGLSGEESLVNYSDQELDALVFKWLDYIIDSHLHTDTSLPSVVFKLVTDNYVDLETKQDLELFKQFLKDQKPFQYKYNYKNK